MRKKENKDEEKLWPNDKIILDMLREAPKGLRNRDFKKKITNESTLSKRLKILEDLYLVKRHIVKKKHPTEIVYTLADDSSLTDKDFGLLYGALDAINYGRNINYIVSILEARSWKKEQKKDVVKESYLKFYPHFLWCLSYASRADSEAARRKIIKLYTRLVRGEVKDWTNRGRKYYHIYRQFIESAERHFNKVELKHQLDTAKELFVSCFPDDLKELASSYFTFYFQVKHETETNILQAFQNIASLRPEKKRFEEYVGEDIPRYRLNKFLQILTDLCGLRNEPAR